MAHTRRFTDEIIQYFPFKPPIMAYIFDNISYKHLFKLYQCCKLFPNQFPLIIIHEIQDVTHIGQYVFYNNEPVSLENVSKIWLSDKVDVRAFKSPLPTWMSKIWISTIECLRVRQNLSFNEFKILTANKTVKNLRVKTVIDGDGIPVLVEDIIFYVPNAYEIDLNPAFVSSETFTKLAAIKRQCKIFKFVLQRVNIEIDPIDVLKFIKVHAANISSHFMVNFHPEMAEDYVLNFRKKMKCGLFLQPQFKSFTEQPHFDTFLAPN